jgi:hypothetical protein
MVFAQIMKKCIMAIGEVWKSIFGGLNTSTSRQKSSKKNHSSNNKNFFSTLVRQ